ncbi:PREDICTED: leucine-rich repeat-containing protein let-4-like [Nicrophorus vespilloides]|uniref:Leucine-rich repeat-containing protein let-4-like n=1 Tax=Nicrophorus vespilloides TaxID=110193 RepID=A0ABM1ML33_NICVS|nr:PREDICTED: leucine-rich repeat-containing protein let-4-like [Nicrophorus vespilloides]
MLRILALIFLTVGCVSAFGCGSDVFKNVTALLYRDPKSNYTLKTVTDYKRDFQNVHRVDVEPINKISRLCRNSVTDLPKLHTLSLILNGIESIEAGSFGNLPALRVLKLNFNGLSEIKAGTFNLPLEELYLSSNKIYKIESKALDDMPSLRLLDLSFNHIQYIDNTWFQAAPKLSHVDFSFNLIREIPKSAFSNLAKLNHKVDLSLMNNTISTVNRDAFLGFSGLGKLWLGANKIRFLDDNTFSNVKGLDTLQLDNNQMFCLSDRFLTNTRTSEVHLIGNPIICNCLVKVEEWGLASNTKVFNSNRNLDKCKYKARYPETTTKAPEGVAIDL